ncbi:MAG: MFS transporter [Fimbriimonadales bacterium]
MGNGNNAALTKVITASSVGTLIEWYDFYIFGSLATTLATEFFPKGNPTVALLSTLATFATGFVVRPFGALFFGRLGDLLGRKYTFLITLLVMGLSTFAIGLMPTYAQIGVFAPILLLLLRLLQGLALGGEYGGATTYVAEHAPDGRRGYYTSFIQTTATLGMFVSLGVILLVSQLMSKDSFNEFGWRIPFLLSIVLVVFSYAIRRRMDESPMFASLKASGKTSTNPLKESFANPENRRLVLLALFGATMGQGVVWYTGQFYALYFLQTVLNIDKASASMSVGIALLIGTPLFIYFGSLSDRIGRKRIILTGMVLASVCYLPIYMAMNALGDTTKFNVMETAPIKTSRAVNPETGLMSEMKTQVQFCEQGTVTTVTTTALEPDAKGVTPKPAVKTNVVPSGSLMFQFSLLVLIQVVFVTMVYGPIAAFLVELFPTRIRYTSLSLPYHIGNGVFGGLVPFIGTLLVGSTESRFAGLIYPISIALICALVGALLITERRDVVLQDA